MYEELAKWWPLLSPPDEYTEEVAFFLQALHDEGAKNGGTLLELGSGGGSNAFHLKQIYTLTLTDLSPDMLAVSQSINPECEHIVSDMRTLRLGRQFDVVFAQGQQRLLKNVRLGQGIPTHGCGCSALEAVCL